MAVNNYALNNVERFKFWCQKVLPLVYDDSLSYYEVLCKVVSKVNEVIDNENAQNELLNELNSEVGSLAQAQSEQYEELSRAISQGADAILALQTAMAGKVDKAQSESDNGKVLGIVNGQVTPTEIQADNIFYATYNVTPFSEIYSAWDDDELVILSRVNQLGHYEHAVLSDISTTTATFIVPANPNDGSYEKITCTASGWDVETVQYSESDLFIATYGRTTFAEIASAIEAEKMVILNAGNLLEALLTPLTVYVVSSSATFVHPSQYSITVFRIDENDTWTYATENYQTSEIYEVDLVNPSFSDITNAYNEGKLCVVKTNGYEYYLTYIDPTTIVLSQAINDPEPYLGQIVIHNDNTVDSEDVELMPANIGSSNAGKVLVADANGYMLPQRHFEVFPVTYGTTTYAEIATALQNQMIPVMVYGDKAYVVSTIDAIEITMTSCTPAGTYIAYVDTSNVWSNESKAYVQTAQGVANAGKSLTVNASGNVQAQMGIGYLDTAPSANNTNGLLIPVVLGENSDPATKYEGYLYIIHEESIA